MMKIGNWSMTAKKAVTRWRDYFEMISTEESPHAPIVSYSVLNPVQQVKADEVTKTMEGKATRRSGSRSVEVTMLEFVWMTSTFLQSRCCKEEDTANWQVRITIPIWKKKGNLSKCANYLSIRLLSHTMKIFEWVLYKRICSIFHLTVNQAGFVKNYGTVNTIQAS